MSIAMAGVADTSRPPSRELYRRGQAVFPGGVTRATIERDPHPIYVARGEGAFVIDVDGHRLLDLNNNFTTLLHGHAFEPVVEAVAQLLCAGSCFANPTIHEIALAELLVSRIPALEKIRFVNTGTEAVMFAVKAARAFTGRPAVARFEGAYHGAYDWAEGEQYRPAPRDGNHESDVLHLRFNDVAGTQAALTAHADRLAAVLIDPMPSRAGLIAPTREFITELMTVARQHGILIIADEVLNLRQGFCGASHRYGLQPDLLTAGKIIGGGFPIGAVGGRGDVMAVFGAGANAATVSQGGTFSANPVSMRAGLVAMEAADERCFEELERKGDALRARLSSIAAQAQAPFSVTGAASLFRIHGKRQAPRTYAETLACAEEEKRLVALTRFFRAQDILLPLGAAASLSTAMTNDDLDHVAKTFAAFVAEAGTDTQEAQQ